MRLLKAEVFAFRRLVDFSINLDSDVVAILGPNEAGKTSVLDALFELEDREPVTQSDRARAKTLEDSDNFIRLHYLLEAEDRTALAHIAGASEARYFRRVKRLNGTIGADAYPYPQRDLRPRLELAGLLAGPTTEAQVAHELLPSEDFDSLRFIVDQVADDLDEDALRLLRDLKRELSAGVAMLPESGREIAATLLARIQSLIEHESAENPRVAARALLLERVPRFAWFSEADRTLASSYRLKEVAADPPPALENLAGLAGLDLKQVLRAVSAGDYALKESLLRVANRKLREHFERAWTQSNVNVELTTDESTLRVFVEDEGAGLTTIAERSEGLRTFVALQAFLASRPTAVSPVLLIDEAEQHLHYDAQADLIRMFTRQRSARQIIYTTHSAGCLPEDLGSSVRMVVRSDTVSDRSECRSGYWDGSGGFDSLLIGMGATTFAFSAARYAVVAEGAADVILLPRFFREVSDDSRCHFQVVPGIAEVSHRRLAELDLVAAKVSFVVDNDPEGKKLATALRKAGVADDRIVTLALPGYPKNTIEDLLDSKVYMNAVNEELRRSHGEKVRLDPVGAPDRPAQVNSLCTALGVRSPNKTAVARRVVELDSDIPVLNDEGRKAATEALALLRQSLGLTSS